MKKIPIDLVLKFHAKMAKSTGGDSGVRDINLLQSALNNAFSTFDGYELYKTVEKKCANICFCIINNHPFVDGNKRMGIYVMLILLEYNGIVLNFTQQELVDLGLGVADNRYGQEDISNWILNNKS
jgi:death-on-curing protein